MSYTGPERRAWNPDEVCPYCGQARAQHDRLAREWERCEAKTAWFARQLVEVSA